MINGCIGIAGLEWFVHISNGIFLFFFYDFVRHHENVISIFLSSYINTDGTSSWNRSLWKTGAHLSYNVVNTMSADDLERKEAGHQHLWYQCISSGYSSFKNRQIDKFGLWRYLFKKAAHWQDLCRGAEHHVMISPQVGHVSRRPLLELNFSCSPTGLIIAS